MSHRAEATDVANAVLDGCDAILLGAETLRGKQPVATVETILHICKQAERVFDHRHHFEHLMSVGLLAHAVLCQAVAVCKKRGSQRVVMHVSCFAS